MTPQERIILIVNNFEKECEEAQETDSQDVWDILYFIRDIAKEIA